MRLVYAILADSALITPDQRVSILGGGIFSLTTPQVPARLGVLALVLRLDFESKDAGKKFDLRVEFQQPEDNKTLISFTDTFTAPDEIVSPLEDVPVGIGRVANFPLVPLTKVGKYTFSIQLNGEEIGRLPLHVFVPELGDTQPPTSNVWTPGSGGEYE